MKKILTELSDIHRQQIEEFRARHKTGVLTLLFTDIVDSTALKQNLGEAVGNTLITEQQKLIRQTLSLFPDSDEIVTTGDSFFLIFIRPSDAVRFSLKVQSYIRKNSLQLKNSVFLRIGIHMGEVYIKKATESSHEKDILGIQVDTAHRVTSLAQGNQILMTRSVFDNARTILRGEELKDLNPLSWMNHGQYRIKGLDDLIDVCEVGEEGVSPLSPPPDTDKGHRYLSADLEPVLGWRPALAQAVPGTEWILEEKLGEGGFGEVWKVRHKTLKERRVFKFCFRADRVRSLKRCTWPSS